MKTVPWNKSTPGLFCCVLVLKNNPSEFFPTRCPDENQSNGIDPKESMEIYQFVPTAGLTLDWYSRPLALMTTAEHSDFYDKTVDMVKYL